MKLLQRYILGELVRVFLLLVAILTVMLVFLGLFQEATERGLRLAQILQILPFVVPSMLPFTIPATLLLTVCIVYGRISGDLEVVAAKAAGISATQLLWPAFLLGGVLTASSFSLTSYVIPWAVSNIEQIVTQAMEDIFLDALAHDRHFSDPVRGFSITVHEVQNRVLKDATFQYRTRSHEQISMRAAEASMRFDLDAKVIRILLKNARGTRSGGDTLAELDRTELTFPLPQELARVKSRHTERIRVLLDTDVDLFAVETQPRADEAEMIAEILVDHGAPPAWFSFGCRDGSTTYGGDDVGSAVRRVAEYPNLVAVGVNCASPDVVDSVVATLAPLGLPVIAYPNYGRVWDASTRSWMGEASDLADESRLRRWAMAGVTMVGGCCGVGPTELARLARVCAALD